jgi:hypothetical protein
VGTVSGSDSATKLLDVVRATLQTTFRPRFELRVPRFFFFDVRFVANSSADYAALRKQKQEGTAGLRRKVARASGLRIKRLASETLALIYHALPM